MVHDPWAPVDPLVKRSQAGSSGAGGERHGEVGVRVGCGRGHPVGRPEGGGREVEPVGDQCVEERGVAHDQARLGQVELHPLVAGAEALVDGVTTRPARGSR